MSRDKDDDSDNLLGGIALIVLSILALWYNEGRFDYAQAARRTVNVTQPEEARPDRTTSYTGTLDECLIRGKYLVPFTGYYRVSGTAEIYRWERDEDDDGKVSWSQDWYSTWQNNERNEGFEQQLDSVAFTAETFRLNDMVVRPATLHFADESVSIPPEKLTLSELGKTLHLEPGGAYFYIRKELGREQQLGDERIRYEGIPVAETATYFGVIQDSTGVGKQFGIQSGFLSKFIGGLIKNDGVLHHLANGKRNVALRTMRSHHRKLKWTVRLAGTGGLIVGFILILSEFVNLLMAIPVLGGLVTGGVYLVSLILGVTISFLTIFTGLAFNNPVTVLFSLGLAILIVVLLILRGREVKANARKNLSRIRSTKEVVSPGGNAPPQAGDHDLPVHRAFRNLAKLALIDGTYDKKENRFLTTWGTSMGLAVETMQQLFAAAETDPRIGLDATAREDLPTLISLALSDGHLSSNELHHILDFGRRLGMDKDQIRAEISRIQRGELQGLEASSA